MMVRELFTPFTEYVCKDGQGSVPHVPPAETLLT